MLISHCSALYLSVPTRFTFYRVTTHSSLRQRIPLNAVAVEAGLVESLCRAAAGAEAACKLWSQSCDVEASLSREMHGAAAEVLLHATFALACLAYEDCSTADVVASNAYSRHCAVAVASLIMSSFVGTSPPTSTRSSTHATTTSYFTTHSAHMIALLSSPWLILAFL